MTLDLATAIAFRLKPEATELSVELSAGSHAIVNAALRAE